MNITNLYTPQLLLKKWKNDEQRLATMFVAR
jgi:hypothetical protein